MKACAILLFILLQLHVNAQTPDVNESEEAPDSLIQYRTRNNLIILPATIDNSIHVNLIVDPHCKTLVLFGKRYERILQRAQKRAQRITPLTTQNNFESFHDVRIGLATRQAVPVIVMPNSNPLNFFTSVNGIIGPDMLADFEIIMDERNQKLTMKPVAPGLASNQMFRYNFMHQR
jgi:hypothetical protein